MKLLLLFIWSISSCIAYDESKDTAVDTRYSLDDDKGVHGTYPVHNFVTTPVRAPVTNFLNRTHDCDDGLYTFITPRGWSVVDPGPMILDANGSLVWTQHFANDFGGQAYDLKLQSYKGQNYLTFWLGDDRVRGHGQGHYHMLDSSYETVHTITAGNGMLADLHDLVITREDTALMIAYHGSNYDLRPAGRKYNDLWNQAIWECLIQETDIETNEVLFEWKASDYINATTSYKSLESVDSGTQQNPYDPFHFNSVQKDDIGNYLISARNTHCIYYVDGKTKEIIWRLGGKTNQFMDLSDGYALNFAWQHDARFVDSWTFPSIYTPPLEMAGVSTTLMTIFDNAAVDYDYAYGSDYSRGVLLELTFPTPGVVVTTKGSLSNNHRREAWGAGSGKTLSDLDVEKIASINGSSPLYTVRVIKEFQNPKDIRSGTQGSVQLISDGKGKDPRVFVGYGLNAVMTTFDSHGAALCDVHYGAETSWEKGDIQSYRAFKFNWTGTPKAPPKIGMRHDELFVSWNGATEVREWLLQSSDSGLDNEWTDISRTNRNGFESAFTLPHEVHQKRFLRVLAFDGDGQACEHGTSETLDRGRLRAIVKQQLQNTGISGSSALVAVVVIPAGLIVSYRVLLPFLRWRMGRGGRTAWTRKGSVV